MKSTVQIIAAGLALAVTTGTSMAQPGTPPANHKGHRGEVLLRILELGLSPAQIADVRAAIATHRETLAYDLDRLASEQRALRDVIQKSPLDEKAIRDAVAKRAVVEAELALTRGRITAAVQKTLTPEQRAKVDDIHKLIDSKVDDAIERVSLGLKSL